MKTQTFLFTLMILVTIPSCKKQSQNGLPYYQFSDKEKALLYTPNVKDTLIYKNQDGIKILFHVVESSNTKQSHPKDNSSSSSGFYFVDYFFDEQLMIMDNDTTPGYYDGCKIILDKSPNTSAIVGIMYFPMWNGSYNDNIKDRPIAIDLSTPTTNMTINTKTYNKVITFNSNQSQVVDPPRNRNVNIIYYDSQYGVIGFNDLNGKNWRLQ